MEPEEHHDTMSQKQRTALNISFQMFYNGSMKLPGPTPRTHRAVFLVGGAAGQLERSGFSVQKKIGLDVRCA